MSIGNDNRVRMLTLAEITALRTEMAEAAAWMKAELHRRRTESDFSAPMVAEKNEDRSAERNPKRDI